MDENTFAPKTAERYSRMKTQEALNKSGSAFLKLCSEALATQLIGREGPRGGKTIAEDPADPDRKQALEERAAQLRQDPAFRNALALIPEGRTAQETLLNRREALAGEGLATLYDIAKEPQQQMQF